MMECMHSVYLYSTKWSVLYSDGVYFTVMECAVQLQSVLYSVGVCCTVTECTVQCLPVLYSDGMYAKVW